MAALFALFVTGVVTAQNVSDESNCTMPSFSCQKLQLDYLCICSGDACNGKTIQCKNDQSCMVTCNGARACRNAEILCPNSLNNYECSVWCDNDYSCDKTIIEAYTSQLYIQGSGSSVLREAKIHAEKSTNLTVVAEGFWAFQDAEIHCPINDSVANTCNIRYL